MWLLGKLKCILIWLKCRGVVKPSELIVDQYLESEDIGETKRIDMYDYWLIIERDFQGRLKAIRIWEKARKYP